MEVLAYSPLARHSVRIGCSLATPKERAASSLLKGQAKRPLMCASFASRRALLVSLASLVATSRTSSVLCEEESQQTVQPVVTEQETKGDLETKGAAAIVGRVDMNTKPEVNDGVEFGLF
jgi:hypothetical protein